MMARGMDNRIEFIYLDLGRVIINFDNDRMCRQMAEVSGVPCDRVREILFQTGLQRDFELGAITLDEFFEKYCQSLGKRVERDRLINAANDIFWLNLPMLPVVAQLQAAGWPLGILSNTCSVHFEWCRQHYAILEKGFRCYALSCDLHALKPDAAIFEAAARLAGVPPERIFFTDDIPAHTEGARRFGYDAVAFQSARQFATELRKRGIQINY